MPRERPVMKIRRPESLRDMARSLTEATAPSSRALSRPLVTSGRRDLAMRDRRPALGDARVGRRGSGGRRAGSTAGQARTQPLHQIRDLAAARRFRAELAQPRVAPLLGLGLDDGQQILAVAIL